MKKYTFKWNKGYWSGEAHVSHVMSWWPLRDTQPAGTSGGNCCRGWKQTISLSRVLRGGGYDMTAPVCRSAFRYGTSPDDVYYIYGFRVVFPL